jgi:microcystin-dependent protein
MATGFYTWSQTSASNATADSAVNWSEGQSPSSVNDSARAMMSVLSKWRDDISGAIVTGGTSTGYTITSNSSFASLALMNGQIIAFTPHTANGATVTLNVDGLGAKPLRAFQNVELQSNVLIAGTPYVALYNSSDAVFYLHGNAATYGVPLGAGMDYWLPTAPSSAFVFPTGQAISRTTYATLFAAMGTTYGAGNGTTTFNLPNKSGRVSAAIDLTGTVLTGTTITGGAGATGLGGFGGTEQQTLTTAQLPAHSHANTLNDPGHSHAITGGTVGGTSTGNLGTGGLGAPISPFAIAVATNLTGMTITNANAGGGTAHPNVQPTICCNYIIRVL